MFTLSLASLSRLFKSYGPMLPHDYCRHEIPADIILASRATRRYRKNYLCFKIARKLKSGDRNFERVFLVKIRNSLVSEGRVVETRGVITLATSSL